MPFEFRMDTDMKYGKYAGKKISEVLESDASYIKWMVENKTQYDYSTEIRNILSAKFPGFGVAAPAAEVQNTNFDSDDVPF